MRDMTRAQIRVVATSVAVAWAVLVGVALMWTLDSLRTEDFDGLNNMFQIPFALPWLLFPAPAVFGQSYEADAWVTAGMGWFNAVLLVFLVPRWIRRSAPD